MTLSDKLSECDYGTRDKYDDRLEKLQERYGTGSLKGVKILSYKIFFPNYVDDNEKTTPMNQIPLEIVRFYANKENRNKIRQDIENLQIKIDKTLNRVKKYCEIIKSRGEKMQSNIDAIKEKQKPESEYFKKHGQYSSAKAGAEWNRNRKERDKKEDEHLVLLFILDLLKSLACEIGYLQLYTFYGLNAAIGASTSVLKNLHELRMKENNASN